MMHAETTLNPLDEDCSRLRQLEVESIYFVQYVLTSKLVIFYPRD